jgi:type IV pilus assembly protein PilQ
VDEHSNSLIISAIRDDLVKMIPIIEAIDKPTPQIQIKANIVETTKDTARDLGIQWGGLSRATQHGKVTQWNDSAGNLITGGLTHTIGTALDPISGLGGNLDPFGMTVGLISQVGDNILAVQLSALESQGKVNILSSPSITTLDNQKAYTENGAKVPISTKDKDGEITTRYEEVTLKLEITPHVIDGETLKMVIMVKKDEIDTKSEPDLLGNPYIIKRQTETTLIVRDGETIVISGLTKQKIEDRDFGIPWLKEIPALGWLFKGQEKKENMDEVLIFITPRILQQFGAVTK